MNDALELLSGLPPLLLYAALGAGAAVENIVPVVPADTFIVAGGFISGLGAVAPAWVFAVVWLFNVGSAVLVYALGLTRGRAFFAGKRGRRLLSPRRMRRMESFYRRWGTPAIFAARFLPGFRALVPVFAGVAGLRAPRVVPPLAAASALWYGALVAAGHLAGDNIDSIAAALAGVNRALLAVSALAALALAVAWRRSRSRSSRQPEPAPDPESEP